MKRYLMKATALAVVGSCGYGVAAQERPNILVLLSDDVTMDVLGCYGGKVMTPAIDSLSASGVRFTQARATATVCTPSRYSFQTGLYAGRSADPYFLNQNPRNDPYTIHFNVRVTEETPTVAKMLREAGYYTGMAGKWHLGNAAYAPGLPRLNPDDDPDDPRIDKLLRDYQQAAVDEVKLTGGYEYAAAVFEENCDHGYMPNAVQNHNLEWIADGSVKFFDQWDQKKPFFFFYGSTVRHGPSHQVSLAADPRYTIGGKLDKILEVQPPRDTIEKRLNAAGLPASFNTTGMLWMDDSIQAILDKLKSLGALENTLIFFCSDHGNIPGKATCYDLGSRAPLLLSWPGVIPSGMQCDALISTVDVVPTILDAAGVPFPSDQLLDGKSLLPLVRGETDRLHETVYTEMGYSRSVTDGRWKYIAVRYPEHLIDDMKSGRLDKAPNLFNNHSQNQAPVGLSAYPQMYEPDQLYDLTRDPGEQNNLATHPECARTLKEMKEALSTYTSSFDHPFPMDADPFLFSARFKDLVDETRKIPPPDWWIQSKEKKKMNL